MSPAPQNDASEKENANTGGFVDVLGILLVAVPLSLMLLAVGAQLAGADTLKTLPDFVTQAWSKIWTWATAAGGFISILLNHKDRGIWRTYLRWILGTSLLLVFCTIGIAKLLRAPDIVQNPVISEGTIPLRLQVKLSPPSGKAKPPDAIWLNYDELYPSNQTGSASGFQVDSQTGKVLPDNVLVDFPPPGKPFIARVYRRMDDSAMGSAADVVQTPWHICLTRRTKDPAGGAARFARLQCIEGKGCTAAPNEDPGWFDVNLECQESLASAQSIPWFGTVLAAGNPQVWAVPSLATLRLLAPTRRTGYTEFNIASKALKGVDAADNVHYSIKVNGTLVLVDGLPEWTAGLPFQASRGLSFDFGLQNLNFSGDDDGCEQISVSFSFRKGNQEVKRIDVSRSYAALRNPITVTRTLQDGSVLQWGGSYKASESEGKLDVLQGSAVQLKSAQTLKTQINNAQVKYQGMAIVGVIRPPLRTPPVYGVELGLVQSNGQIRFTYDTTTAQAIKQYVVSLHQTHGPFATVPLVEDPSTRAKAGNVAGACESLGIGN